MNPNNGAKETLHDRPPLVLRATVDALGLNPRPVIVIVNHPRSFIDIEPVGGEVARAGQTQGASRVAGGSAAGLQTANPGTR